MRVKSGNVEKDAVPNMSMSCGCLVHKDRSRKEKSKFQVVIHKRSIELFKKMQCNNPTLLVPVLYAR